MKGEGEGEGEGEAVLLAMSMPPSNTPFMCMQSPGCVRMMGWGEQRAHT